MNAIAVCVRVFRSVTDSDMNIEVAPGVSVRGADVVGKMADDGDSGGCPMGLQFPSVATRGRVVDKDVGGGGRGSPRDFASPNKERIGPWGRGQLAGRVYRQRVSGHWVLPLRGYVGEWVARA